MTIYLDLDETLIHSEFIENHYLVKNDVFEQGEYHKGYITFVRPIAWEFIDFCHELVGRENLFILTAASKDYAEDVIKGIGCFDKFNKIISSRETEDQNAVDEFPILVDDFPRNYEKLRYLGILEKPDQAIRVIPFNSKFYKFLKKDLHHEAEEEEEEQAHFTEIKKKILSFLI